VVVSGDPSQKDTQALLKAACQSPIPFCVVALRPADEAGSKAEKVIPLLLNRQAKGAAEAFLCVDQVCDLPTSDVAALADRLIEIASKRTSSVDSNEETKDETVSDTVVEDAKEDSGSEKP
jgi:uncharacterized protein YyaL (SSP411 family)